MPWPRQTRRKLQALPHSSVHQYPSLQQLGFSTPPLLPTPALLPAPRHLSLKATHSAPAAETQTPLGMLLLQAPTPGVNSPARICRLFSPVWSAHRLPAAVRVPNQDPTPQLPSPMMSPTSYPLPPKTLKKTTYPHRHQALPPNRNPLQQTRPSHLQLPIACSNPSLHTSL